MGRISKESKLINKHVLSQEEQDRIVEEAKKQMDEDFEENNRLYEELTDYRYKLFKEELDSERHLYDLDRFRRNEEYEEQRRKEEEEDNRRREEYEEEEEYNRRREEDERWRDEMRSRW